MKKEIRIVEIHGGTIAENEKELERLVNEGWVIVAAGNTGSEGIQGFVILQKD